MERKESSAVLLLVALVGLLLPNGLFLYWLLVQYEGPGSVAGNTLAVSFILDAFLAVGILAYLYAKDPVGKVRWYWFVALSLAGGLAFSIPFYRWLNRRSP